MTRSLDVAVGPACISSGYCRNAAPTVFGTGPERKAIVLTTPVEDGPALQEALQGCPVEAISAHDVATGDLVFPDA